MNEYIARLPSLPKVVVRGRGGITYRCAACGEPIPGDPAFFPPLPLTPDTRAYHQEHLPNGR